MRAPLSAWALAPLLVVCACAPRTRGSGADFAGSGSVQHSGNGWKGASPEPGLQRGKATFYGEKFRGRKTASGARFDPDAFTCAHRTLPFGTRVEVRRPDTGQTVQVVVTDRGPFGHDNRIVDLSLAAARTLNMTKLGVVDVELRVVGN